MFFSFQKTKFKIGKKILGLVFFFFANLQADIVRCTRFSKTVMEEVFPIATARHLVFGGFGRVIVVVRCGRPVLGCWPRPTSEGTVEKK